MIRLLKDLLKLGLTVWVFFFALWMSIVVVMLVLQSNWFFELCSRILLWLN